MRALFVFLLCFTFSKTSLAEEKSAEIKNDGTSVSDLKRNFVYANFYYHSESRENAGVRATERNLEFSAGFDRLINTESHFYVGGRGGVYQEQVLSSVPVGPKTTRPFVGGQAYWLLPFENMMGLKLGLATDILFDLGGPDSLWLYVGALGGLRFELSDNLYAEIPFEFGVTPFFAGTPILGKVGLQIGFGL